MKLKRQNKLLDRVNEIVEDAQARAYTNRYMSWLRSMQNEMMVVIEEKGRFTKKDFEAIFKVKDKTFNMRKMVELALVNDEITKVINDPRMLNKSPLKELMAKYNINNRNLRSGRVSERSILELTGDITDAIVAKEAIKKVFIKVFTSKLRREQNEKILAIIPRAEKAFKQINNKIADNTGREMLRRFNIASRKSVEKAEILADMKKRFNAKNSNMRSERIVRTESHAITEEVKLASSILDGFTHKR